MPIRWLERSLGDGRSPDSCRMLADIRTISSRVAMWLWSATTLIKTPIGFQGAIRTAVRTHGRNGSTRTVFKVRPAARLGIREGIASGDRVPATGILRYTRTGKSRRDSGI